MKKHLVLIYSVTLLTIFLMVSVFYAGGKKAGMNTGDYDYIYPLTDTRTLERDQLNMKELSRITKVNIHIQGIPEVDYQRKIKQLLDIGDIPDLLRSTHETDWYMDEAVRKAAFLNLEPYLDKYPVLKLAAPGYMWENFANSDGGIYFIPMLKNPYSPTMMFYREDWFSQLGIAEPQTLDDLLESFKILKTHKPDIQPFITPNMDGVKSLATSFGAYQEGWFYSEDQLIRPWFMSDNTMKFYMWFQNLYKNDMLYQDFLVNSDLDTCIRKFANGQAAVISVDAEQYLSILQKTSKNNTDARIGIMTPLTGPDGKKEGVVVEPFPIESRLYISAQTKNPDEILGVLAQIIEQGQDFIALAKEYTEFDGTKQVGESDFASENPFRLVMAYKDAILPLDKTNLFRSEGFSERFALYKIRLAQYCENVYFDYRNRYAKSRMESDNYHNLLNEYITPYFQAAIINEGFTSEDWTNQLEKWLDAGGDKIIAQVNDVQKRWDPNIAMEYFANLIVR